MVENENILIHAPSEKDTIYKSLWEKSQAITAVFMPSPCSPQWYVKPIFDAHSELVLIIKEKKKLVILLTCQICRLSTIKKVPIHRM